MPIKQKIKKPFQQKQSTTSRTSKPKKRKIRGVEILNRDSKMYSRTKKNGRPTTPSVNKFFIAGQFVELQELEQLSLLSATEKIMKAQPSVNYNITGEATYNNQSLFLNMLGATICKNTRGSDFSLVDIQTQEEISDNTNVFDEERTQHMQNRDVKINDKFPSKNDPIYELDNRKDETQIREIIEPTVKEEQASMTIASDLATINLSSDFEGQVNELEDTLARATQAIYSSTPDAVPDDSSGTTTYSDASFSLTDAIDAGTFGDSEAEGEDVPGETFGDTSYYSDDTEAGDSSDDSGVGSPTDAIDAGTSGDSDDAFGGYTVGSDAGTGY